MALWQGLILNGQEVVNQPVVVGDITMGSLAPNIHSLGGQILSIYGNLTGYVRIGAAVTSHALANSGALLVSNALEVDADAHIDGSLRAYGVQFLDGVSYHKGYSQYDGSVPTNGVLWTDTYLGSGSAWLHHSHTYNQVEFGLSANAGRQLVITDYANFLHDHDHATQTNPTLFVHSATDPDVDNTQWLSAAHNQTDAVITTGTGNLILNPITEITEVCGVGLKTKEYNATVNDGASISLPAGTGWGTFMIGDNQEYARVRWTSGAVPTVDESTANVATSDLAGNLCFIDGGGTITVRNRLGSNLTLRFVIHYS
jgi:hypothetical protein